MPQKYISVSLYFKFQAKSEMLKKKKGFLGHFTQT